MGASLDVQAIEGCEVCIAHSLQAPQQAETEHHADAVQKLEEIAPEAEIFRLRKYWLMFLMLRCVLHQMFRLRGASPLCKNDAP